MYRVDIFFFFFFFPPFLSIFHSLDSDSIEYKVGEYFPLEKNDFASLYFRVFHEKFPFYHPSGFETGSYYTGAHRVERRPRWQERDGFRLLDAFITPLVTSSGVGGTHDWIRSTLDSCYRVTPVEFSVRRRLVR